MQHQYLPLYAELSELEPRLWASQVALLQHLQQVVSFGQLPASANTDFVGGVNSALSNAANRSAFTSLRRCCLGAQQERPAQCGELPDMYREVLRRIQEVGPEDSKHGAQRRATIPERRVPAVQERIDTAVAAAGATSSSTYPLSHAFTV
jgi:hypothetical protein